MLGWPDHTIVEVTTIMAISPMRASRFSNNSVSCMFLSTILDYSYVPLEVISDLDAPP